MGFPALMIADGIRRGFRRGLHAAASYLGDTPPSTVRAAVPADNVFPLYPTFGANDVAHREPTAARTATPLPAAEADHPRLQAVLGRDHVAIGRALGLGGHGEQALGLTIDVERQKLDAVLDAQISSRRAHAFKLRIALKRVAPETEAAECLQEALAHNEECIEQLQEERRLAVQNAGWFACVHVGLTAGFRSGQERALDLPGLLP